MSETSSLGLGSADLVATAKLTLARSLSSALVWSVVALTLSATPPVSMASFFIQTLLAIMIGAPLYYFMIKAVGKVLGGIPFVTLACNLLLLATAVLVAIGDPIVFAINKRFPDLLGIADFKLFNLVTIIIVHR